MQNTTSDSNQAARSDPWDGEGAGESPRGPDKPPLAEQLREGGHALLESAKQRLVGTIAVYESAILDATSKLRQQDHPVLAERLKTAADSVGNVKHYLGERSDEQLLDEASEFCRRHPGACFAGAFLAGLAAARFFKARTPQTNDDREEAAKHG